MDSEPSQSDLLNIAADVCLAVSKIIRIDSGMVAVILAARAECHTDIQALTGMSAASIGQSLATLRRSSLIMRLRPPRSSDIATTVFSALTVAGMEFVGNLVATIRDSSRELSPHLGGADVNLEIAVRRRDRISDAWKKGCIDEVWSDWPSAPTIFRHGRTDPGTISASDVALFGPAYVSIHRAWSEEASQSRALRLAYLAAVATYRCGLRDAAPRVAVLRSAGVITSNASARAVAEIAGVGRAHAYRLRTVGHDTAEAMVRSVTESLGSLLPYFGSGDLSAVRRRLYPVRSKFDSSSAPENYCPMNLHDDDWRRVFETLPEDLKAAWKNGARASCALLAQRP